MSRKKYSFDDIRGRIVLFLVLQLAQGLIPAVLLSATASFLDCCIAFVEGEKGVQGMYLSLLFFLGVMALNLCLGKVTELLSVQLELCLYGKSRELLLERSNEIAYARLEQSHVYEQLKRLLREPEIQWKNSILAVGDSVSLAVKILALLYVIGRNAFWSAAVITAAIFPMIFSALKGGKKIYDSNKEAEKWQDRSEYEYQVLTGKEASCERTLFGFLPMVFRQWEQYYEKASMLRLKGEKLFFQQYAKTGILLSLASLLGILLLLLPFSAGRLSTGLFISLTGSLLSLLRSINSGINRCCRELGKAAAFVKDYREFMLLSEEKAVSLCETYRAGKLPAGLDISEGVTRECDSAKQVKTIKTIEIRHLSFHYPDSEFYVLKDLNLTLERGRQYSLIGINGAGKTTLIKILCGLYTDYEGEILVNGTERLSEYYGEIAAVFQDFARFSLSVKENICLGKEWDAKRFQQILQLLALTELVEALPDKEDTLLGKIYEKGQDFSGGQWQKLAVARLLYQQKDFVILDEPTAALDPVAESRLYENFGRISQGRTVLFISHRLASVYLTDRILVLSQGHIAEEGSFAELIALDGCFAKMYREQRGWYQYEKEA